MAAFPFPVLELELMEEKNSHISILDDGKWGGERAMMRSLCISDLAILRKILS